MSLRYETSLSSDYILNLVYFYIVELALAVVHWIGILKFFLDDYHIIVVLHHTDM